MMSSEYVEVVVDYFCFEQSTGSVAHLQTPKHGSCIDGKNWLMGFRVGCEVLSCGLWRTAKDSFLLCVRLYIKQEQPLFFRCEHLGLSRLVEITPSVSRSL